MKFHVQKKLGNLCRLGLITNLEGLNINIETPSTLLFLKDGHFPFLTPDLVSKIKNIPSIIQCPLNYIIERLDVLEKFNNDLSAFIGQKGKPIFITQGDQSQDDMDGGLSKNSVSVWCTSGRRQVTLSEYFRVIKSCKPLMWQAPCDNETPIINPSAKRLQKGVERTISFLNETLKEITNENLPGECLISFTGGMNWLRRRQCLERMLLSESKGIIIDGFHGMKNCTGGQLLIGAMKLIENINLRVQEFDDSKVMMLPKLNQPFQIVQAVKRGIDLFDGAFPYLLTASKIAWVYPSFNSRNEGDSKSSSQWLQLTNSDYQDSFDLPIDPNCTCFACENHTRGYINHLIKTSELLADILLMSHNSTQYYQFFHEMRISMANDSFDAFHDWALQIECPEELLTSNKMCC